MQLQTQSSYEMGKRKARLSPAPGLQPFPADSHNPLDCASNLSDIGVLLLALCELPAPANMSSCTHRCTSELRDML